MINVPYEVKKALRLGNYRKNYKIKVYDNSVYQFTIDNDTLIKESVKIDERMVTGKVLEFGLCEGSSLEFEYFNHPNINGKRLEVLLSVQYGDNSWHDIPMGWFDVDQCPMQWDTGIYKVTAFNKLKSEYLDAEAKNEVKALVEAGEFGHPGSITMYMLLEEMLKGYRITPDPVEKIPQTLTFDFSDPVGRYYRMYDRDHHALNDYFEFYTLTASFSFQLNTLDDYYRLDLDIDGFDIFTNVFRPSGVFIKPDENAEPMRINEAIAYNDEYGDGSLGDALHGTVKLVKAEDHSANYFAKRCGVPAEDPGPGEATNNIMADYAGCYKLVFTLPVWMQSVGSPVSRTLAECISDFHRTYDSYPFGHIYRIILSEADSFRLTTSDVEDLDKITLRELQSAVYELDCQYGQLDRETDLFKGVELNQGGLHPADGLYPANGLYPSGQSHIFPSSYQKLWTDTGGEQSFRYLIITYKTTEIVDGQEQEVEKKLQRTVNANGTTNYNMSDNWLFRNLIWTAEDVGAYADAMVLKMKDITWFPFEMWCVGLPYLETGDALEIVDREGNTHISYILNRQLNGIHDLRDTFINGELDVF